MISPDEHTVIVQSVIELRAKYYALDILGRVSHYSECQKLHAEICRLDSLLARNLKGSPFAALPPIRLADYLEREKEPVERGIVVPGSMYADQ